MISSPKAVTIAVIEPVGGHSGMDYYDFGLCQGLVAAGAQVRLYTCDETKILPGAPYETKRYYRRIFGRDPIWLRGWRYLMGSITSLFHARWVKTNICHFHLFLVGPLEFFNICLAKLLGMKVVITAHDVEAFANLMTVSHLAGWIYRLANLIITHNQVSRRELMRVTAVSEAKIAVIPSGSYLHTTGNRLAQAAARQQLGLNRKAKLLLFFGQIKTVKGLDLLLQALPEVIKVYPEVILLIAGRVWKDDFAVYEQIIKTHQLDQYCIKHLRYISDEERPVYYMAADLVVLPYKRIYQSAVLLMAMSYGLPVLTSDLDGMTEIVQEGQTGFLFSNGNAQSLANKLIEIFSDPAGMQRMAANGLKLMKTEFSWDRIGEQTLNALQPILNGDLKRE